MNVYLIALALLVGSAPLCYAEQVVYDFEGAGGLPPSTARTTTSAS